MNSTELIPEAQWAQCTATFIEKLPVLIVPFEALPGIYAPEKTVLQMKDGSKVYAFKWCYLKRRGGGTNAFFDKSSLSNERVLAMPLALTRLSKWFRFKNSRPRSNNASLNFLGQLLDWADQPHQSGRYERILSDSDLALEALKRYHTQLQHITQEMAMYYSSGFSRAVNLVFDKTHFSHEWEAAKAESSYFAYAFAVLFSDEELLGQGVARMANAVESRSREDTLRLFEAGKLAFQETPLGGCVSIEECKTHPLEPIPFDCLESNCVNMVVFGKRLEHIIKHQEVTVANLARDEAGSVEYRLEARHLEVLLKARGRLNKGAA